MLTLLHALQKPTVVAPSGMQMIKEFSQLLGPLRLALALVLGILAAMAPFALAPTSYEGWAFVTTVIVPALVPIFFFVTLLDVLMSAVFMSSSSVSAGQSIARC